MYGLFIIDLQDLITMMGAMYTLMYMVFFHNSLILYSISNDEIHVKTAIDL